ncbi:hypothetical protein V4887_23625, partial [Ralstonia solanacearum species complex bacterium KE449]|uniref:hypothetical protein n=1 Tax=Ralstonia solanacearum species complex bacterium KE449 TaxID=3119582 RepID=UPI002FC39527
KLRADLSDLQSAYSGSVRSRPLTLGAVVLSAILTVACLAGLANLAGLLFGGEHQLVGGGLHRRRCLRHLFGGLLHPADQ